MASMAVDSISNAVKYIPLLLPMLNLALVFFQQTTSGLQNAAISTIHAFSNPIASLWSILCRQDKVRHHYLFTVRYTPDIAREFAAVLATYDQWLEDLTPYILEVLTIRQRLMMNGTNQANVLLREEKVLIRRSALRLRSCRVASLLNARISVVAYLFSLCVVVWKVWLWNDSNRWIEAGHILSLIAIHSHLIFAIYLNAGTGTFMYHEEAVRIIFELHSDLKDVAYNVQGMPPLLTFPTLAIDSIASSRPFTQSTTFSRAYDALGSVSGVLNSIRPLQGHHQTMTGSGPSNIKPMLVGVASVLSSLTGALAIAMTTVSTTTYWSTLVPIVGCLSLWLLNWAVSVLLSLLLARKSIYIPTYGYLLLTCDVVFGSLIFCCFGWSLMTWQKTDTVGGKGGGQVQSVLPGIWITITLLELAVTPLLEIWASCDGSASSHIYVRSFEEALADSDSIC